MIDRNAARARGTRIGGSMTRATMVLALASVACGGDDAGRLGSREDAYRANNRGIARLEQFDYPAAAAAFRDALSLDDTLGIARVNLALALYYDQDFEGAAMAATVAARWRSRSGSAGTGTARCRRRDGTPTAASSSPGRATSPSRASVRARGRSAARAGAREKRSKNKKNS